LFVLYPDASIGARAALSCLFIGIFLLFSSIRYQVPELVNSSVMGAATRNLYSFVKALELRGSGIFVPKVGVLLHDKCFVPLHEGSSTVKRTLINEEMVLFTQGFAKDYGAFVNSPGCDLIDLFEKESETMFSGIGAMMMCSTVKVAEGLDLVHSIDADYDDETKSVKIVFRHGAYESMCSSIRREYPDMCTQACCPICSAILGAFARSESSPIQVESVTKDSKVRIKARFMEWASDAI
jgi:hypothetical protein